MNPDARSVPEWLAAVAAERAGATALLDVSGSFISYHELDAATKAVGDRLAGVGVGAGNVVLIALPDGPDALLMILGAARVGVAFPVGSHESDEKYRALLDDVVVHAIVCDDRSRHAMLEEVASARGIAFFRLAPGRFLRLPTDWRSTRDLHAAVRTRHQEGRGTTIRRFLSLLRARLPRPRSLG